jgi:isopenicillin-N N-acyltransferase-like protein
MGRSTIPRGTLVVRIEGSGRQRGEAYGEQARALVHESVERWTDLVARQVPFPIDRYVGELVEKAGFVSTAARLAPDLVDEIEGIAAASGADRQLVLALNLLDEDWWFRARLGPPWEDEHCSAFAVRPATGQPALLGQNMDLRGLDGLQVLLDIRPAKGPRVLAPTYAGMIATNALNEYGVGVCVNSMLHVPTSTKGLPVSFVIRTVASTTSYEDAVRLLASVPHASGQNYLIGSPIAVGCFECWAGSVTEYAPGARIAHTNHPLTRSTSAPNSAGASAYGDAAEASQANSVDRLTQLRRRLIEPRRLDVSIAKKFLAEPPLCRGANGDPGTTFYSVIMEPAQRRLWLTAGPPDRSPFRPYDVRGKDD